MNIKLLEIKAAKPRSKRVPVVVVPPIEKLRFESIAAEVKDRFSTLTFNTIRQEFSGPNAVPVPPTTVRGVVDNQISKTGTKLEKLGESWRDGKIGEEEFKQSAKALLRELHLQTGSAGQGGLHQMNATDYARLEAKVKSEHGYLDGFVESYADDPSKINMARLDQYVQAARNTYEVERQLAHMDEGFGYEVSVAHTGNSCGECADLDGEWAEIGTIPAPGDRTCSRNCGCTLSFSRDRPEAMDDDGPNTDAGK